MLLEGLGSSTIQDEHSNLPTSKAFRPAGRSARTFLYPARNAVVLLQSNYENVAVQLTGTKRSSRYPWLKCLRDTPERYAGEKAVEIRCAVSSQTRFANILPQC